MTVLSLWKGLIEKPGRPTMREVIADVAEQHGLTVADLQGQSRRRRIAWVRQEAMAKAYELTNQSMPQIGQYLGGRDHTTVMWGVRAHEKRNSQQGE